MVTSVTGESGDSPNTVASKPRAGEDSSKMQVIGLKVLVANNRSSHQDWKMDGKVHIICLGLLQQATKTTKFTRNLSLSTHER